MHFKNTLFYILLFCLIDSGTSFSVEKTAKACGLDTIAAGEGLPTSSGQARPLTPGSNRPATLHDYFVEQGQAFHKQLVQGDTRALPDWQQQQRMMEHLLIQDPKTAVEIAALMRMRGEVNSPFIKLDEKVRGMGGLSPFLKTYALDLAHAQRLFDTEADYYSVVRALAEAEAKGEPFDPTRYEAFWPTHGFAHSLNIASNGRKIVEALQKLEPGKYQDALLTYAELMGLTHDMGMRAGGAHIRKNHAQVGPFIGLGGKVDGMETQKMLVDQFIERFTDRTNNDPLAVLLRDAADSDFIQKMYPGKSKKERQELLLREMFVGSLSHENGDNYDPKLGPNPALVAERRAAAIRLLTDPKFAGADAASVADIKKRYPDFDSNFLSWLVLSEKDYKNNPALKQLRDVFWQGEAVLNIADADRVGGLGRTKGVGNTQSAIVETPEGLVLAVAISSPDGRKALMEMKGSDRLGRYLRTGSTVVGDDQHITERVSISPLPVVNPDTYVKVLRDVSRVIGQTSSYQRRGYTPIIGHRFRSEIHIPSVMAGEMAPPARLGFETSVVAAAARVNFRNADTVLVTRDTDGNAPINDLLAIAQQHAGDPAMRAWLDLGNFKSLPPTEAEFVAFLQTQWNDKAPPIPKPILDYFRSQFTFEWEKETSIPYKPIASEIQRTKEREQYWKVEEKPIKLADAYAQGVLDPKVVEKKLVKAGAPMGPRKTTLPSGAKVDYAGPKSGLPDNAEVVVFEPGTKLTEFGDPAGYGYVILEGDVEVNLHPSMKEPPIQVQVKPGDSTPATVIGFTSNFNEAGSTRNATVYVTKRVTAIVIPFDSQMSHVYNGNTMMKSPQEILSEFRNNP